ncbi:MAG: ATP-binding protein [Flavobacteriales bacterium]|nr:ATP-binding protein [Flavobacteriales bacterium]
MKQKEIITNWNVITGGPCTGKTTVVEMLSGMGYATTIEHARHYIDSRKEQGRTVDEIRANKRKFQRGILEMQIEEETKLDPNEMVFLDRALPDALAYYQFLGLDYDEDVVEMSARYCYRTAFILARLPLINDYARLEDLESQIRIHNLIIEVYNSFPCPVVHVPVLPPQERVEFILNNIAPA